MITVDQMRSTLLTVDEVYEILSKSEPITEYPLDVGNSVFYLEDAWNHGLDAKGGNEAVGASVVIGGHEVPMTKDALLQATSLCGLSTAYVKRTPAKLIEPHLNYWYGSQGLGNRPAKILVTNDKASAVTRQSINPFSNVRLLDSVLEGIKESFGDEQVLVDSKFHHSVAGTHMRLVLPQKSFVIHDSGVDDDEWCIGLNLHNSLVGKTKTSLDGYLFRWWCLNGAIDTKASSGTWTRGVGAAEQDDIYAWARDIVGGIMSPLDDSAHLLQAMTSQSIEGDVNQILSDLFDDYKLPARDRKTIIANMVEEDSLTMYSLMQAVTEIANDMSLSPEAQAKLMHVGGDLTHSSTHRCEACHRLSPVV
jgi:hypothetical protein